MVHIQIYHIFCFSQADQKKEEGNQLYKTKNYRDALQRYSEAIGNFYSLTITKQFVVKIFEFPPFDKYKLLS